MDFKDRNCERGERKVNKSDSCVFYSMTPFEIKGSCYPKRITSDSNSYDWSVRRIGDTNRRLSEAEVVLVVRQRQAHPQNKEL
jgi:hypothetical protein